MMKRATGFLSLISICLLLASCGGGGSSSNSTPPPAITISLLPATISVNTNATEQFTATVSGTTNTTVTWQVNGTTGGDTTVGTISTAGLYTAPATVPSPATVTVKAIASADSTKTASSAVTITEPPVKVTMTPAAVVVQVGMTEQFTAQASGGNGDTTVTWTLSGGSGNLGTISSSGLYTAPATLPSPINVTVTATANADNTTTATANVTLTTLSNSVAMLNGSYAFHMMGEDGNGFWMAAGSMTADGNGNITGGEEDRNGATFQTQLPLTGTYTIDPNGHGTLTLDNTVSSNTYAFQVLSPNHIKFISLDTSQGSFGEMMKQDNSAFSTAAITGDFSFGFDGFDATANSNASTFVGRFTADGAGNITNGLEDINEAGTYTPSMTFTGTYSVDSSGRGTAIFTTAASDTRNFVFYVVSANTLYFMESEYLPNLDGTAQKQTATFTDASLTGPYAFLLDFHDGTYAETATVGMFTSDGAGNLTAGSVDESSNDGTTFTNTIVNNAAVTGTYSIDATGRGTASVSSSSPAYSLGVAFYMVSPQEAYVMNVNPALTTHVQAGPLLAIQGGPFDNTFFSGPYALQSLDTLNFIWREDDLVTDGGGNISGMEYMNLPGNPLVFPLTGTYSIDSSGSGRGTASYTASNLTLQLVVYLVSSSKAFVIEADQNGISAGIADKQQ